MVPALVYAVGCILVVAMSAVLVYRNRVKVHVSGDSDDEDDDNDPESESSVRAAAETAALMNGERQSVSTSSESVWSSLFALLPVSASLRNPKPKSALMRRRNQGVKKIHKPYFYPLLDETAQWFAEWESTKLHASQGEVVDVRIDKSKDLLLPSPSPSPSSASSHRDYLDGLDCVSLAGFRSSNHTVMPVAVV